MGFGCTPDEKDSSPAPPVEAVFRLVNESGQETTSFSVGEDILFDYALVNRTDEGVSWYFSRSEFNYPDLFTVFRKVSPNAEMLNGGVMKVGTPHTSKMYRDFRLGRSIPANGEMSIRMTWLGNWDRTYMFDNWMIEYHNRDHLPAGNYYVEFEQEIVFAKYKNLNKTFRIDFEVK